MEDRRSCRASAETKCCRVERRRIGSVVEELVCARETWLFCTAPQGDAALCWRSSRLAGRQGGPLVGRDVEKGRRGVSAERAARWARELGAPVHTFVKLALQAELDAAGLNYRVEISAA